MVSDVHWGDLRISRLRYKASWTFFVAKMCCRCQHWRPGKDSPFRDRPEEESLELEHLELDKLSMWGFFPKPRYPRLDSSSSFRIFWIHFGGLLSVPNYWNTRFIHIYSTMSDVSSCVSSSWWHVWGLQIFRKMRAGEMAQATCLAVAFLPGFLRGRQVTVHGCSATKHEDDTPTILRWKTMDKLSRGLRCCGPRLTWAIPTS
jgi:hypothetical protein